MTQPETFQLSLEAAEAYESKFVPALFAEWASLIVEAAGVGAGHAVLDVACGTGVVAREAANRVGASGRVVGADINKAMLAVARRLSPELDWRRGDACDLPFPDGSFDAVLCQAALMFFPDPAGALREMGRVVSDTGTVAVQVWAGLDTQPAYGPFVEVAVRHAGPEAAQLLGAYWTMGDLGRVSELFTEAGLRVTGTKEHVGTARFTSIEEMVRIEVESTPLVDRIDDGIYGAILADARAELAQFETVNGNAEVPILGHILSARR
jgi:SAM-dependent methyltransferase